MSTLEYSPGQWIAVDTDDSLSACDCYDYSRDHTYCHAAWRDDAVGMGDTEGEAIADLDAEMARREA